METGGKKSQARYSCPNKQHKFSLGSYHYPQTLQVLFPNCRLLILSAHIVCITRKAKSHEEEYGNRLGKGRSKETQSYLWKSIGNHIMCNKLQAPWTNRHTHTKPKQQKNFLDRLSTGDTSAHHGFFFSQMAFLCLSMWLPISVWKTTIDSTCGQEDSVSSSMWKWMLEILLCVRYICYRMPFLPQARFQCSLDRIEVKF